MTQTPKQPTSFIAPDRLYTLRGFQSASGINSTRMHLARRKGIDLQTLCIGKRRFVRGADAIMYIEKLAAIANLN